MTFIKREMFIWDFLKKEMIPKNVESVTFNNITFDNSNICEKSKNQVTTISLVPSYVNLNFKNKELFKEIKITNTNLDGSGITINENDTLESYLQNTLSRHTRKNLQRFWNRLNQSFNIKVNYYHGQISRETFTFLMSSLYHFLIKRFNDKQKINSYLINWDQKTEPAFNLINNKKASLFVIYNEDTPINITLNYHTFNTILFSEINGFDTNYYKFGLGHIDLYLHLKWCFDNNYKFLDLGNGTLDYKKKWCNTFYNIQYVLLYKKGSILSKTLFIAEKNKLSVKNFLKKIKLDELILKTKYLLKYSKNTIKKTSNHKLFTLENLSNDADYNLNNAAVIDLKTNTFLKNPVYDSLFNSNEHINDITIYMIAENTYVIKGKKSLLKIKTTT
ncbi:hypothetical protein FJ651_07790 [Paucihalobacter ruber]|uniref:BioF2-like acetyltransferase domain-containing protein n=1 Tax=Paucihalobacter ruber TaxID=2567861 RepID=A0A506PLG9_9FLAO|nr:hypothetical protein [Paucihalobacter ruber]TPV34052.1 hypothetical protein FJ651_07790 [Paucihalobacter ruber]